MAKSDNSQNPTNFFCSNQLIFLLTLTYHHLPSVFLQPKTPPPPASPPPREVETPVVKAGVGIILTPM